MSIPSLVEIRSVVFAYKQTFALIILVGFIILFLLVVGIFKYDYPIISSGKFFRISHYRRPDMVVAS